MPETEVELAVAPPRNVFEREATVAAWDSDYYHPIAERYYDAAISDMLAAMGAKLGDRVLDAGCGPGVHAIRAARYGCQVTAVDLSERMLAHARERAERAGVTQRIQFRQGDLTKLNLQTEAYPFAFCWGVLIHVPDALAALDELARVVTPGGRLALQVSGASSLDFALERALRRFIGKPLAGLEQTPLGAGLWYDFNDDRLWVQRFDTTRLVAALAERGLALKARRAAEFTEFQWRAPGFARPVLLHFNRAAYALRFPAALSCTQILIFEKLARRQ